MKIAIIGAGMSGLISAHALAQLKIKDVVLYDKSDFATLYAADEFNLGSFCLYESCNLDLKPFMLHCIILHPTGDYAKDDKQYQMKVYKKVYKALNGKGRTWYVMGYDIIKAKRQLLMLYEKNIKTNQQLNKNKIMNLLNSFDYVISTLPLSFYFPTKHFPFVCGYTTNTVIYDLDIFENYEITNVHPDIKWYRTTKFLDVCSTEYVVPVINSKKIIKVISHTEKLEFPKRFISTGRQGKWKFRWMIHHTYNEILQKFKGVE